eukprot:jgi/Psemu1/23811/gm1.23811_g
MAIPDIGNPRFHLETLNPPEDYTEHEKTLMKSLKGFVPTLGQQQAHLNSEQPPSERYFSKSMSKSDACADPKMVTTPTPTRHSRQLTDYYSVFSKLGTESHVLNNKNDVPTVGKLPLDIFGMDNGYGKSASPGDHKFALLLVDHCTPTYTWEAIWKFFADAGGFPRHIQCNHNIQFLGGNAMLTLLRSHSCHPSFHDVVKEATMRLNILPMISSAKEPGNMDSLATPGYLQLNMDNKWELITRVLYGNLTLSMSAAYDEEYDELCGLNTVTENTKTDCQALVKEHGIPGAKLNIVVLGNLESRTWDKGDQYAPVISSASNRLQVSMTFDNGIILKQGDCKNAIP